MNVDSILISEYATTDPAGRLTVVNCYNRITTETLPAGIGLLCLSLVVHGAPAEAGTRHKGEVKLLNQRREVLGQNPISFEFTFKGRDEMEPGMPLRWIGNFKIMRLVLSEEGPYAFEVYIDGTYHAAASLVLRLKE